MRTGSLPPTPSPGADPSSCILASATPATTVSVHLRRPFAPALEPVSAERASNVSADAVTNIVIIDDIDCKLWMAKGLAVALFLGM